MNKILEGVLIAVVGGVATTGLIYAAPGAFKWLTNPEVPSGAVLAFDRPCPDGWELYTVAGGRVIVGAGEHPNSNVSAHKLGATGGEEKHKLTIKEMPSHSHSYAWQKDSPGRCGLSGCSGHHEDMVGQTSSAGEGDAHNNMQPFVALHYCRKL